MRFAELRNELKEYYSVTSYENAERKLNEGSEKLNSLYKKEMTPYEMKTMQYKIIAEIFEPVLFENSSFYYETGLIPGFSDGARDYKGYKNIGGWTYWKNSGKFIDADRETWELTLRQRNELFYLVCGEYNDTSQHFQLNARGIFECGFKGIYEKAAKLAEEADGKERDFLNAVCAGLLCVKKMSEKFAAEAEKLLKSRPGDKKNATDCEFGKKMPVGKAGKFLRSAQYIRIFEKGCRFA